MTGARLGLGAVGGLVRVRVDVRDRARARARARARVRVRIRVRNPTPTPNPHQVLRVREALCAQPVQNCSGGGSCL